MKTKALCALAFVCASSAFAITIQSPVGIGIDPNIATAKMVVGSSNPTWIDVVPNIIGNVYTYTINSGTPGWNDFHARFTAPLTQLDGISFYEYDSGGNYIIDSGRFLRDLFDITSPYDVTEIRFAASIGSDDGTFFLDGTFAPPISRAPEAGNVAAMLCIGMAGLAFVKKAHSV